jgi:hypothetical protein
MNILSLLTFKTLILLLIFTLALESLMSMITLGPVNVGANFGFLHMLKSFEISALSPILNLCGTVFLSKVDLDFRPCSVALWCGLAHSFCSKLNISVADVSP